MNASTNTQGSRNPSQTPGNCPFCGGKLPAKAVLCTGCGKNLVTGEKLATEVNSAVVPTISNRGLRPEISTARQGSIMAGIGLLLLLALGGWLAYRHLAGDQPPPVAAEQSPNTALAKPPRTPQAGGDGGGGNAEKSYDIMPSAKDFSGGKDAEQLAEYAQLKAEGDIATRRDAVGEVNTAKPELPPPPPAASAPTAVKPQTVLDTTAVETPRGSLGGIQADCRILTGSGQAIRAPVTGWLQLLKTDAAGMAAVDAAIKADHELASLREKLARPDARLSPWLPARYAKRLGEVVSGSLHGKVLAQLPIGTDGKVHFANLEAGSYAVYGRGLAGKTFAGYYTSFEVENGKTMTLKEALFTAADAASTINSWPEIRH